MAVIRPLQRLVHAAVATGLVAFGAGCPLLEVDAELPEVCMTQKDVQIDGVPVDMAMAVDRTFTFDDLSAFAPLEELDAEAHFVSATVRATHGIDSLAFVESASVEVASNAPESTLPTLTVYACDGDCLAQDAALVIPVQDRSDALAYIRSGSLSIRLQATGALPTEDWTMDVETCVAARASYAFDP